MKMRTENRALDKIYKRRDRYEIPDWQREEVWGVSKKQKLIDSILRGWQLPKFYFLKVSEKPEEYEVIDGQQRLTAIFEFLDNELSLSEPSQKRFGAKFYKDLNDTVSDAFDDFEIQFDEIVDADEKDLKEFFLRLQEGLPLTSSEKLNAVDSKLRDFCVKLAKSGFFVNTCALADKRYAYFDIASKAITLEIEGLGIGLRLDDMREVFESQASFSPNSQVAKRIKAALSLLENTFPKDSLLFRNRAITQSFITLACRVVENSPDLDKLPMLESFGKRFLSELSSQVQLGHAATDPDYIAFQKTINANVKSGPRTRHRVLIRKLLQHNPELANVFDPITLAEGALDQEVLHQGESIAGLITTVNEAYASANGVDLFKPTNKTANGLKVIRTPVKSYEDWKRFVESLYFLFREGTGSKLNSKWPPSFVDINDLRTALQHDVDHGEKKKVEKQRKRLSATFKRLSGSQSPDLVDPAHFIAIQSRLLSQVLKDIHELIDGYITS